MFNLSGRVVVWVKLEQYHLSFGLWKIFEKYSHFGQMGAFRVFQRSLLTDIIFPSPAAVLDADLIWRKSMILTSCLTNVGPGRADQSLSASFLTSPATELCVHTHRLLGYIFPDILPLRLMMRRHIPQLLLFAQLAQLRNQEIGHYPQMSFICGVVYFECVI